VPIILSVVIVQMQREGVKFVRLFRKSTR